MTQYDLEKDHAPFWIVAVLAAAWSPAFAQAVPLCATRDAILDALSKKYQEEPVAFGVTSSGGMLELLTAKDGSTWTIILSTPRA